MEVDGRHCEAEVSQRQKANINACQRLLDSLLKHHGVLSPPPEPKLEELVPIVKRNPPVRVPTPKAEARFVRYIQDEHGRRIPAVAEIKGHVAKHYGVTSLNLDSQSRAAKFVTPRQIAMYLCKQLTLRSLPDIGRRFGGRDHTTVLHAVRKIEKMVQADEAFASQINELKDQINDADPHNLSPAEPNPSGASDCAPEGAGVG